jgi:DNA mismatch repair protein MutS
MKIKEFNDEVVFLHEVINGAADRSYGLHVAKLAGLPQIVIERAGQVLDGLEHGSKQKNIATLADDLPLFASMKAKQEEQHIASETEQYLQSINPDELSPKQALEELYKLKEISSNI